MAGKPLGARVRGGGDLGGGEVKPLARFNRWIKEAPISEKHIACFGAGLTPRQAILFELFYFERLRIYDIADKIGVSKSVVDRDLAGIRIKLNRFIAVEGG